jgi:hypothetical protein
MAEKTIGNSYPKTLNGGMHNAIIGDDIVHDIPSKVVYVTEESELASFTDISPVGTYAAIYGLTKLWQLDASKEWVEV